jgi:hypothetical protein
MTRNREHADCSTYFQQTITKFGSVGDHERAYQFHMTYEGVSKTFWTGRLDLIEAGT